MKRHFLIAASAAALLAGCSQAGSEAEYADGAIAEGVTSIDIEEPEAAPAPQSGGEIPVSTPQIAYIYEYGFRLAGSAIPLLQERHVALCESMGPTQCQVIEMRSSGGEGDYASGYLNLAVAAPRAREFGAKLGEAAENEGGEQVSASISGEDLSKQIVDTEARLRARTVLRDRLMEVLRNRQGDVAELVAAERSVAQVNEEIDQARSWLAEMRGRVNFSRVNVSYSSGAPSGGGFMEPIRNAFGSIGSILGNTIAALIIFLTIALPVGLLVWGGLAVRRQFRTKREAALTAEASQNAEE